MKALFVTPGQFSAGEAITAIHCADRIANVGGDVYFLASPFTAGFLDHPFTLMMDDIADNQACFFECLRDFRPDAVVFADFCMTFFSSGVTPLGDAEWLKRLRDVDAALFTFDHLGYAQGAMEMFFGPPDSGFTERIQEPPEAMHILLPCPVQSPDPAPGRRGVPFRYWKPPQIDEAQKAAVRKKYAGDSLLVFHSVPTWARVWTEYYRHPYYDFLADILSMYLADVGRSVCVVSVNDGKLLGPSSAEGVWIGNLSTLPKEEYEALILCSDLMLTENRISVSLGKAVCGGVPGGLLQNSRFAEDILAGAEPEIERLVEAMEKVLPGAVYPYEVFPIFGRQQVDKLGVFENNSYPDGVAAIEIFGGSSTRDTLRDLLTNDATRSALREKQMAYANAVAALPEVEEVIAAIISQDSGTHDSSP